MLKRLRKICLAKNCKCKSTHFGIGGKRNNGLCNYHYNEFMSLSNDLIQNAKFYKKYYE